MDWRRTPDRLVTRHMNTDHVVQIPIFGADDRTFEKQQRRSREGKRAIKKIENEPHPLPDGPCCGRCRAWVEPVKAGEFGRCQFLGVTTAALGKELPRGTIIDWETARRAAAEDKWDELKTRAWAGTECSAFTQREEKEAA
jgi:hypothetical protein